ncbi:MAG: DUF3822 family protein [Cytophagales bacterium]|nr:DUF3822 family protein [Cytophagales bacterium]
MAEEKTTYEYKLVRSTIDKDRIQIDDLHHYNLSVMVGDRDLQVCVTDSRDFRCLLLDDYILDDVQDMNKKVELIHRIFLDHQLLSAGFWKSIKVAFKNRYFTQLPEKDFVPGNEQVYLALGANIDSKVYSFLAQEACKMGMVTVFAAPTAFVQLFNSLYPNKRVQYYHQSSTIIQGSTESAVTEERKLYLYVDRFSLHITVLEKDQLIYYNQFIIKRFEDYIKYITLICNQLKVSTLLGDLTLWGFLGTKTGHYRQLQRYIPNIILGDRPEQLKFGYVFDELEDNHYFDIFQLSLNQPKRNSKKETVS